MGLRPVMSFDVFDTVLTRTVGEPRAVFDLVARDLRDRGALPQVEPVTLARLRYDVELRLLALRDHPPRIREIHEELARSLNLPASAAEETLAAELDWERRTSRAVPGMVERVRAARAQGDVVFVSDTPLPAVFLQELLTTAGLFGPGDRVYSSADEGATKAHGGDLFARVQSDLARPASAFHHTGDNGFSDVAEPKLRGWSARLAGAGSLNRYEHLLERSALTSDGLSSALAGASRLGRLQARAEGVAPDLADVVAGVATPLLAGYGLWLLQRAQEQGLQRLYFLARDGEVMLEVMRPLAAALGVDVELRYLYGSRAAWEVGGLRHSGPEELRDRLRNLDSPTVRGLVYRLGLTVDDVRAAGDDAALQAGREDLPLSAATVERLAGMLTAEPLLGLIRAHAEDRHRLALDYLRQEGLGEPDVARGVVDVGWMGRTFQALDTILTDGGLRPVEAFFYIGRSRGAAFWSSPTLAQRQSAFLFDQLTGAGMPDQPSGVEVVVETFCTGSEGSVRGYRREGDRVVPVLVRPVNETAQTWGLGELRRALAHTVAALTEGGTPLGQRRGDLAAPVDAVLREFWERPTPGEVEVWGDFPMESGDDHEHASPLASPIRTRDVVLQLRARRLKLRPTFSWRAGTAVVSDTPWNGLLRGVRWYGANGARLRRIPRRARLELALRRE